NMIDPHGESQGALVIEQERTRSSRCDRSREKMGLVHEMCGFTEAPASETIDLAWRGQRTCHAVLEAVAHLCARIAPDDDLASREELLKVRFGILPRSLWALEILDLPESSHHETGVGLSNDATSDSTTPMAIAIDFADERQQRTVAGGRWRNGLGLE